VGTNYRLIKKIGSGSFGDIYLGINILNNEARTKCQSAAQSAVPVHSCFRDFLLLIIRSIVLSNAISVLGSAWSLRCWWVALALLCFGFLESTLALRIYSALPQEAFESPLA
jgi:serine/threonine protein kinase